MGNALEFLSERTPKKDVIKSSPKITKCPDATMTIIQNGEVSCNVNHRVTYKTDLKGYNARAKEKRIERECSCCTSMFKPNKYTYYGGIKRLSKHCEKCDGRIHADKRAKIKKMGGWGNYTKYKSTVVEVKFLSSNTDMSTLEYQLELRKKFGKPYKMIQKFIDIANSAVAKKEQSKKDQELTTLGFKYDF